MKSLKLHGTAHPRSYIPPVGGSFGCVDSDYVANMVRACRTPIAHPFGKAGSVVIVPRGNCTFFEKVTCSRVSFVLNHVGSNREQHREQACSHYYFQRHTRRSVEDNRGRLG